MLRVLKAGLQTTLQGAPRLGQRQFGFPHAGPADAVSMALANRLVGNPAAMTALEITYGGFEAEITDACSIALTGASGGLSISGEAQPFHKTLHIQAGHRIVVAPPEIGVRSYLAIHSGFDAKYQFGATSTYLPAAIGGLDGRALQAGDEVRPNRAEVFSNTFETPESLRSTYSHQFAIRACESAETHLLDPASRTILFSNLFSIGQQATRMGLALEGAPLNVESDGRMKSVPVFPGIIQCPPSGVPIALSSDAQTTGGYPRIASIARCDRHLLGQIRPGDQVRLLKRSHDAAAEANRAKKALLAEWLER